jgi:cell division protease FtsH
VGLEELQESIERVMAGPQRKSKKISEKEKKIAAFHESGHALVSLHLPNADPLHKVTIIPRGMAGGYTMFLPDEDRSYRSKEEFLNELPVALGGRAAEEIVFGDITTGAQNDLQKVSATARAMVCQYGMSEKLGHMTLGKDNSMVFLGRDLGDEQNYSEETARVVDSEIKKIIDTAYRQAHKILSENRGQLDILATALMEKETLESKEIRELLGFPSHDNGTKPESKPAA